MKFEFVYVRFRTHDIKRAAANKYTQEQANRTSSCVLQKPILQLECCEHIYAHIEIALWVKDTTFQRVLSFTCELIKLP